MLRTVTCRLSSTSAWRTLLRLRAISYGCPSLNGHGRLLGAKLPATDYAVSVWASARIESLSDSTSVVTGHGCWVGFGLAGRHLIQ